MNDAVVTIATIPIVNKQEELQLSGIQAGVLIVYPEWSGPSRMNSIETIKLLHERKYSGEIIIINNDCMTPEFQESLFGQVCHGWGEIFIISNGKKIKQYLGKNSYRDFKIDEDKTQFSHGC